MFLAFVVSNVLAVTLGFLMLNQLFWTWKRNFVWAKTTLLLPVRSLSGLAQIRLTIAVISKIIKIISASIEPNFVQITALPAWTNKLPLYSIALYTLACMCPNFLDGLAGPLVLYASRTSPTISSWCSAAIAVNWLALKRPSVMNCLLG